MSSGDLGQFFGGQSFDPASVEPAQDFETLPAGKYTVMIDEASVNENGRKTGHYIKVKMTVLDGPAKNRVLYDNINIANPSATCVEIGMRSLAALSLAVGLTAISSTDMLLGKVVVAHVKVKDGDNNIRTYSAPSNGAPAPIQSVPPAVAQPAQPATAVQVIQPVQQQQIQQVAPAVAQQGPAPAPAVAPAPVPAPVPAAGSVPWERPGQ